MAAYYNEFDPFAAAWLRELIAAGLIAPGDVDERSIKEVQADDLRGYAQCHFFAGIGGWSYAARLAGWADDRPLWTGSCPCQPFSVAGKGAGVDDPRHLWPDFLRLIRACRPPVVMGEQVAGKAGYGWLDGVLADLAGEDYAGRGVDIPACAVDAPHIRQRLYWVACDLADAGSRSVWLDGHGAVARAASGISEEVREQRFRPDAGTKHVLGSLAHPGCGGPGGWAQQPGRHLADGAATGREEGASGLAGGDERGVAQGDAYGPGLEVGACQRGDAEPERAAAERADAGDMVDPASQRRREGRPEHDVRRWRAAVAGANLRNGSFWSDHEWLLCHDGKARRTQPGSPLLAHGIPRRVAKWRGFGNAIVPQLAAQVIGAFMDAEVDDAVDALFS